MERRSELRERPVLRGPAMIVIGSTSLDVSIVNTSRAGLMIRVPASATVPASFILRIGDHEQACDLIWRHETLIGARLSN